MVFVTSGLISLGQSIVLCPFKIMFITDVFRCFIRNCLHMLMRQILALSIRPKIPEIPGEERMERTFSGISFRNFRCTSRACPNIPENRNNRGRFPFDQKFRIFRVGDEWNRHFPEFHSEFWVYLARLA